MDMSFHFLLLSFIFFLRAFFCQEQVEDVTCYVHDEMARKYGQICVRGVTDIRTEGSLNGACDTNIPLNCWVVCYCHLLFEPPEQDRVVCNISGAFEFARDGGSARILLEGQHEDASEQPPNFSYYMDPIVISEENGFNSTVNLNHSISNGVQDFSAENRIFFEISHWCGRAVVDLDFSHPALVTQTSYIQIMNTGWRIGNGPCGSGLRSFLPTTYSGVDDFNIIEFNNLKFRVRYINSAPGGTAVFYVAGDGTRPGSQIGFHSWFGQDLIIEMGHSDDKPKPNELAPSYTVFHFWGDFSSLFMRGVVVYPGNPNARYNGIKFDLDCSTMVTTQSFDTSNITNTLDGMSCGDSEGWSRIYQSPFRHVFYDLKFVNFPERQRVIEVEGGVNLYFGRIYVEMVEQKKENGGESSRIFFGEGVKYVVLENSFFMDRSFGERSGNNDVIPMFEFSDTGDVFWPEDTTGIVIQSNTFYCLNKNNANKKNAFIWINLSNENGGYQFRLGSVFVQYNLIGAHCYHSFIDFSEKNLDVQFIDSSFDSNVCAIVQSGIGLVRGECRGYFEERFPQNIKELWTQNTPPTIDAWGNELVERKLSWPIPKQADFGTLNSCYDARIVEVNLEKFPSHLYFSDDKENENEFHFDVQRYIPGTGFSKIKMEYTLRYQSNMEELSHLFKNDGSARVPYPWSTEANFDGHSNRLIELNYDHRERIEGFREGQKNDGYLGLGHITMGFPNLGTKGPLKYFSIIAIATASIALVVFIPIGIVFLLCFPVLHLCLMNCCSSALPKRVRLIGRLAVWFNKLGEDGKRSYFSHLLSVLYCVSLCYFWFGNTMTLSLLHYIKNNPNIGNPFQNDRMKQIEEAIRYADPSFANRKPYEKYVPALIIEFILQAIWIVWTVVKSILFCIRGKKIIDRKGAGWCWIAIDAVVALVFCIASVILAIPKITTASKYALHRNYEDMVFGDGYIIEVGHDAMNHVYQWGINQIGGFIGAIIVIIISIPVSSFLVHKIKHSKEDVEAIEYSIKNRVKKKGKSKGELLSEWKEEDEETALPQEGTDTEMLLLSDEKKIELFGSTTTNIIKFSNLKIEKEIGMGGSNSVVYKAKWNHQLVAVKIFKLLVEKFLETEQDVSLKREMKLMSSLSHPNVIGFFGICLAKNKFGLVMEFCSLGDVRDFLLNYSKNNSGKNISLREKLRMIAEIASGMAYLNVKKTIHRDLKCENVLVNESHKMKIMDFGLSRAFVDMQSKTFAIGTSKYMAPEICLGKKYGFKVDVYSYSIMIHEIITENFDPFQTKTNSELRGNVHFRAANDPSFRPSMDSFASLSPSWLVKLTIQSWAGDDSDRPSFSEICEVFSRNLDESSIVLYVKEAKQKEEEAVDYEFSRDSSLDELKKLIEKSCKKKVGSIYLKKRVLEKDDHLWWLENDCSISFVPEGEPVPDELLAAEKSVEDSSKTQKTHEEKEDESDDEQTDSTDERTPSSGEGEEDSSDESIELKLEDDEISSGDEEDSS